MNSEKLDVEVASQGSVRPIENLVFECNVSRSMEPAKVQVNKNVWTAETNYFGRRFWLHGKGWLSQSTFADCVLCVNHSRRARNIRQTDFLHEYLSSSSQSHCRFSSVFRLLSTLTQRYCFTIENTHSWILYIACSTHETILKTIILASAAKEALEEVECQQISRPWRLINPA